MFKNAQFNVFKGKSACRLSFIGQQQDFTPGFLFLELAEVKGKNGNNNRTYDWENKIGIKLSGVDISKLAYAIERGDSGELFHEFNGTTKIISIKRADAVNLRISFPSCKRAKMRIKALVSLCLRKKPILS